MFLTQQNIKDAASKFNLEVALIKAVIDVESKGSGFISLDDIRPIILFEGHIFWRELKRVNINPILIQNGNENILYPLWDRKQYFGGKLEYTRLERALRINREAALKSTSWGLFQIMGFNYTLAGYEDLEEFVNDNYKSELTQLNMFLNFITNTKLIDKLRNKDWEEFSKGYNGKGYKLNNYDIKLKEAYYAHNNSNS